MQADAARAAIRPARAFFSPAMRWSVTDGWPAGEEPETAIWTLLTASPAVVVTTHHRPDGDAVGASLALWHALTDAGVVVRFYVEPPVPAMLEFLPGLNEALIGLDDLPADYCLVVVDCGEFDRVGQGAAALVSATRTVNIDHHVSNDGFGDVTFVDPQASSCGELVYRLLSGNGRPLTAAVAECLFTAIVTDTGQFAFENTTPAALEICAECIRAGARPEELADRLFLSPSPAQFELRRLACDTVEFHAGGKVASMVVTREMFARTGLGPVDTDRFANIPLHIHGVMTGVLLKEMPDGDYIKASMRSRAPVDVCAVAQEFGGGGHARAAGCELPGGLGEARRVLVARLCARVNVDEGQ